MIGSTTARTILLTGLLANLGQATVLSSAKAEEGPAIKSAGLEASIVSAIPQDTQKLTLTVKIKNTTKDKAFALIAGNVRMSTSAGADLGVDRAVRLTFCAYASHDPDNLESCKTRDGNNIDRYDAIEPGESVQGTLYLIASNGIPVKISDTLNYSLKIMVRYGAADSDLSAPEKPPGPLHVATMNFPPITLSQ